jgi:phage shock protein PspC (stress-responsive transcriptional regulator)
MEKKLYRSATDKKLGGIFGGLGKYLNVDATLLRVLYAIIFVVSAFLPTIILYVILWAVIPEEPKTDFVEGTAQTPPYYGQQPPYYGAPPQQQPPFQAPRPPQPPQRESDYGNPENPGK